MSKKILMCIATLLVLVSMAAIQLISIRPCQKLIIEDSKNGIVKKIDLPSKTFVLSYTHSVLLTPADEYFRATKEDEMILYQTVYESFGVGLPYEQAKDTDFIIKDGKFILYLNRKIPKINMVISSIPDHYIKVDGVRYPLIDYVDQNSNSLSLYVKTERQWHIFDNH